MMTIIDQFREARAKSIREGRFPTKIVFSTSGYDRLRSELDGLTLVSDPKTPLLTFSGLPFEVDPKASSEIELV